MANYKESKVSGQSWTRCKTVICENPNDGVKAITFIEEDIVSIKDRTIATQSGSTVQVFDAENAKEEFNLVHPDTGKLLGKSTFEQAYAMLHSLYLHTAAKRDISAAGSQE